MAIRTTLPELDIRVWPDAVGNPDDVEVALAWLPPPGVFAGFVHLKAILSLGAGVEHILKDPKLPVGIPIARLIDPGLRSGMVEFVTMEVLRHHRRERDYRAQQKEREWRLLGQTPSRDRCIGILGLGHLGEICAITLKRFGFRVSGWSRSDKFIEGVDTLTGEDGLFAMLERSDILICLLPLTPQTEDILDATTMGALPKGAVVINVGRGQHLVDEALIKMLDSGHLSAATLDVYREEPLPNEHPFWAHPKITMYPHAAAWSLPSSAAPVIVDNIRRVSTGQDLFGQIDRIRGY
ncbi:MAG: glyoxylate/hydroxypyruvate reductase A [Pseudomonadota bacterium]|nr:glyoxylate/hydroxypyruvate reductase A [Pseudomonadota bacterium]